MFICLTQTPASRADVVQVAKRGLGDLVAWSGQPSSQLLQRVDPVGNSVTF